MNNKVNQEKYRGLSISGLAAGILGYSLILIGMLFSLNSYPGIDIGRLILNFAIFGIFGIFLPVTAIVCGSIDLNRIQAGRYSNKGRGLDIAGIILGSTIFLIMLVEVILPH